jgi:cytochrome c-type biogenesis protein
MSVQLGFGTAFLAGVASFLSPCVLPLIPGYLSFISGLSLDDLSQETESGILRGAGLGSIFFVLGFSVVFIALGASATAIGRDFFMHRLFLDRVAGGVIILFGLHMSGLVPIRLLYYEKRAQARVAPGFWGAFIMGLAFAFGWTPCIGPILGAILALAATQRTLIEGMRLLAVYSLGLGIPFILAAFGLGSFLRIFKRYKNFLPWIERISGLFLVLMGFLIFFNRLPLLLSWFEGRL